MKILVHKDLILAYIRKDYSSDEHRALVKRIFDNENSIFLYSQRFIHFLKNEIDQSPNSRELVFFNAFVDKIQKSNQDKRPNIKTLGNSSNIDEELKAIIDTAKDNVIITIAYNQPNQELYKAIPNIAILSQQQKPNYHWLVINLAIIHPFTLSVDEIDFQSDEQVDTFFTNLFFIPKKITEVTIFDDYYNVEEHNKYNSINNRRDLLVYYCTENHHNRLDGKGNYNTHKYNIIKQKFPRMELMTKNRGSHTRRIIFEGFIINPDNDLSMTDIRSQKMWSIHIRFIEERAREILELRNDYTRFDSSRSGRGRR